MTVAFWIDVTLVNVTVPVTPAFKTMLPPLGCSTVLVPEKEYELADVVRLLNNPNKRFNGVDGNFYFKNNMIERDLSILKINNGNSFVIN